MNKTERYTRYALVIFVVIAVLLLGTSMVSAEHGKLPQDETEPVAETTEEVYSEEATEEVVEEPEAEQTEEEIKIIYEEESEDYGYCEDVVEDTEEPETEWAEPSENEESTEEHECNTWINETEFDNGMHVWECEECGSTELWEWFDEELDDFDPDDHECTEFTTIDEDGYYYCVECEAGYFEE